MTQAGAVAYGGHKAYQAITIRLRIYVMQCEASTTETKEEKKNANPFDGPVDEGIFMGDISGNITPVPEGHQLEGTNDGKWIQVKDKNRVPTGTRKDGGGHHNGHFFHTVLLSKSLQIH